MKKKTTLQSQVWKFLQEEYQRTFLAENLRPLKKKVQEDLCLGILVFLKSGIIRKYEDAWANSYFQAILLFIRTERELGLI